MPRLKKVGADGSDQASVLAVVRELLLPLGLQVRGLSREDAARYVGVSASKFDQMVSDGRMPRPKHIDARRVWDRKAVDLAFDVLPGDAEDANPWDVIL